MSRPDEDAGEKRISIIIPNYNKASTVGKCLEAAYASDYNNFEVIVVDDCSTDNSIEVIKKFPCTLISLEHRSGTSKARNGGARRSTGEFLFFTDSDCLLLPDTLSITNKTLLELASAFAADEEALKKVVLGGTYTTVPYDRDFFSTFQSAYINYSETKRVAPDYIAAHAMVVHIETFTKSGGFPENFLPIIEDVEYSHRLRKGGHRLVMNPAIQVQHIFRFSLGRSLKNAFRKSKYWNIYSLQNRDMLSDSGTASVELKADVGFSFISLMLFVMWMFSQEMIFLTVIPVVFLMNAFISRRLLKAFYETKGCLFAAAAFLYYALVYPFPVGAGVLAGIVEYFFFARRFRI